MIKAANKYICCLISRNAGITKEFSSTHNGTDWGWMTKPYAEVYPMQDGIVREAGYEGESTGIGYYVTIEHQYDDGTHSFSGYIHLKDTPKVKKGDVVEAGKTVLGYRGGSPYIGGNKSKPKYAPHIHLYTTGPTTKGYSWNTMKSLVINPFKTYTFCRLKGVEYTMGIQDGHAFGNAPIYEEMLNNDTDEIKELKEQVAKLTEERNAALKKLEEIKRVVE